LPPFGGRVVGSEAPTWGRRPLPTGGRFAPEGLESPPLGRVKVWQLRCLGLERSSCSASLSKTWAFRPLEHALRALDLRVQQKFVRATLGGK
jgi:hypothetical protein